MILADVMDEIGDALDTIDGLRVHRWPADSIEPPAAIVQFPTLSYDRAFQRGTDSMEGGIAVLVSQVWDRIARDAIAKYCDGAGAHSVHAALQGFTWTTCSFARVTRTTFPPAGYTISGINYVGAQFDLRIAGPGS